MGLCPVSGHTPLNNLKAGWKTLVKSILPHLFHDGGPYHTESSPLTSGFYMIGTSVMNVHIKHSLLYHDDSKWTLTLSFIMSQNGQTYLKNSASIHKSRFLKYVWPFCNIMKERVLWVLHYDLGFIMYYVIVIFVTLWFGADVKFIPLTSLWPKLLTHLRKLWMCSHLLKKFSTENVLFLRRVRKQPIEMFYEKSCS